MHNWRRRAFKYGLFHKTSGTRAPAELQKFSLPSSANKGFSEVTTMTSLTYKGGVGVHFKMPFSHGVFS